MLALLLGCATGGPTRAELDELRASLRALRQENGRIEARLERLEEAPPPARGPVAAKAPSDSMPSLTVVKLKPKAQAAPRINTHVDVVEPPDGLVEEIKANGRSEDASDEADVAVAEVAYQKGLDALKTGNVEGGLGQLKRFAVDWPRHPRADNALYFVGVALMSQQDFAGAAKEFESVRSQYPAGDAMVDAMLKLGECRLRLNQPELAKATWERLVITFPGTAAASQAQTRLASLSADQSKSLP